VNPCAPELTFSDRATRHRRDNAKLLGLIRAVTLAHQHQRPRRQVQVEGRSVTYIETTPADVEAAERLCAEVLGTTTDELSPATRRLLASIGDYTTANGSRFTRRELREATGMGDSQLKVHLSRLVDLEYVVARGAGPATAYELACDYDADEGADRPGQNGYRPGQNPDRPGIGRVLRHRGTGASPQDTEGISEDPSDRPVIGRVPRRSDDAPFAQLSDPQDDESADRSGSGQLRVVGAGFEEAVVGP